MASSSSTGEEPPTSSIVANAPLASMEASLIVATGRGHCQQLKDMLSKEDSLTMDVVMASSNNQTSPPKPRTSLEMDARLLKAACSGSFQDLESLLNGEDRQAPSDGTIGSSADDEEAFLRESLLDGVTVGGDTLLHVVAANCNCEGCLHKVRLVHTKAQKLLFMQNNKGDTPLQCAARVGNTKMVSLLITLAKGQDNNASRVKELLEKENKSKETSLHEVVRAGNNDIVELLMVENRQLASLPKDGTSPLYLAILLERKVIAETLHEKSEGDLSYSGPNGQNALHAAVLRGKDLTEMLLKWNNNLTLQRDKNGSTPLHFAAVSMQGQGQGLRDIRDIRSQVLEANPDALYQPDHNGSFPTHMAASVGARRAITDFLKKLPNCAILRDARERTFLHVAVDKRKPRIVGYACRNQSLSWILNMQDNNGNTALHLATQAGSFTMFCQLFGNRQVHLNLTNKKGETPLDIARCNLPKQLYYNQNSEVKIHQALKWVGAKRGFVHRDYFKEVDIDQARQDEIHQMDQVKEGTQSLCIGSVLIATVTFGASFAMPGGYRADDHTNGGTPTLAGRYIFDAFALANTLAFTFSAMATISLMSSGSPMYNLRSRKVHLRMAFFFMTISVTSLASGFALGTYMLLAPVADKTAITVCVLSSLALLYQNLDMAIMNSVLITTLGRRMGICNGIVLTFPLSVFTFVGTILLNLWPVVVIFGLAALNYYNERKVEPAAQPPTPFV